MSAMYTKNDMHIEYSRKVKVTNVGDTEIAIALSNFS